MMVAHRRRKTLERKCGNEVALVIKRTFADYAARRGPVFERAVSLAAD
jgi:hypothetical protein